MTFRDSSGQWKCSLVEGSLSHAHTVGQLDSEHLQGGGEMLKLLSGTWGGRTEDSGTEPEEVCYLTCPQLWAGLNSWRCRETCELSASGSVCVSSHLSQSRCPCCTIDFTSLALSIEWEPVARTIVWDIVQMGLPSKWVRWQCSRIKTSEKGCPRKRRREHVP